MSAIGNETINEGSLTDRIKERFKKTRLKDENVADLKKLMMQAKGAQSRFLSIWELNRAFYNGDQWVFWNRTRLDRPRLDISRVLLVDNRIQGIVRTEIAKMSKRRPNFSVVPRTPEQEDVQAAQTGEKILEYLWKCQSLRKKLEDVLLWSRVCAAGWWKITWDSSLGDKTQIAVNEDDESPILHHETGAPLKPDDLKDETGKLPDGIGTKTIATGDIRIEVVSPFEFFVDPVAKNMQEAEWVIQSCVKSHEYVKAHWNVDLEPDTQLMPGPSEVRVPTFQESGSEYKGIKVFEYWCRPDTDHPNGRYVIWAKDKILEEGDNPYGCLPFVMFQSIPIPGRFMGTCIVEHLRGPQTELNKIKSQIIENAQRIGNPSLLKSRQADIKMSGVPGEEIEYDDTVPNSVPSYLKPPDMPAYVIEQITRCEQSLQEISGQHEVSNAQVPPGVKAASAINLLQEADDTRLGPGIYAMEEALSEAGEMILKLAAKYWTDERVVMIAGENHKLDAMTFRGAALRENTKVEVQTGSMLPKSKAAQQAAIQDMLALAFQYQGDQPMNPRMLAVALKDLEVGGLEKLFGDISKDESQVNRENQEIAQDIGVAIHAYDNHKIHIEGHEDYQKSASYANLGPRPKKMMELHVSAHRMAVLGEMQPPPSAQPQPEPEQVQETHETEPPPPPAGGEK